jgi:TolA-binding protein
MRRPCATSIVALTVAILLAGRSPSPAAEPWYDEYQGALKAISNRRWKDAETRLLAALRSGPNPGRRVRTYGVRFIDYLPEYQLGIVYFNEQRYADALEQFAKVQASGVLANGDTEYQAMAEMIASCRLRTASSVPDASRDAAALVGFARDLVAKGSLKEARQALDAARAKDPRVAGLEALNADLGRRESELEARESQAKLDEAARAQRDRVPAAAAADPRANAVQASAVVRQTPAKPPAQPSPLPSPVSDRDLQGDYAAAFEAFYAGRYAAAAPLFSHLAGAAAANRPALLLYAACSHAGSALLQQPVDAAELTEAKRLFREAGPSAPRIIASDRLVSPRVVEVLVH